MIIEKLKKIENIVLYTSLLFLLLAAECGLQSTEPVPDPPPEWTRTTYSDESVYSFAISKQGDVFSGGLNDAYLSIDRGISWVELGLPTHFIYSIAINSEGHIFAGVGGNNFGLYVSKDNGVTWIHRSSVTFVPITVSINASDDVFLGTNTEGIFRSTDDGETWEYKGLSEIFAIRDIVFNSKSELFAAAGRFVFQSQDNGDTWKELYSDGKPILSIAVNDQDYLFVGKVYGAIRSTDSGMSWTELGMEDSLSYTTTDGKYYTQLGFDRTSISDITINSSGLIFFATPGKGVFLSRNNGDTWIHIGMADGSFVTALAILSNDRIFAGSEGGMRNGGVYYLDFINLPAPK